MATLDTVAGPLEGELGFAYDADITASALGEAIDLKDVGAVAWFFTCITATSGKLALSVYVCDTVGGTYVTDPDAKYTINNGAIVDTAGEITKIGYSGDKRFAKLYATVDTPVDIGGVAVAITDPNTK